MCSLLWLFLWSIQITGHFERLTDVMCPTGTILSSNEKDSTFFFFNTRHGKIFIMTVNDSKTIAITLTFISVKTISPCIKSSSDLTVHLTEYSIAWDGVSPLGRTTPVWTDRAQRESDGQVGICRPERGELDCRLTRQRYKHRRAWLTPGPVRVSAHLVLMAREATDPPVFLPGEPHGQRGPGGLHSPWAGRVGHDWATKHTHNPDSNLKARCHHHVLLCQVDTANRYWS